VLDRKKREGMGEKKTPRVPDPGIGVDKSLGPGGRMDPLTPGRKFLPGSFETGWRKSIEGVSILLLGGRGSSCALKGFG